MSTVLDNLIKLKPKIDLGYRQKCPNCPGFLITNDFYIFGWRNLAVGTCNSCKKEYVFEIATGHGIPHPCFIEIGKDKVYAKKGSEWFNKPFLAGWLNKNYQDLSISCVKNNKKNNKAILINCLDIIYGHSIIKLLSLTYYLKNNYQNLNDIIILVPKSLLFLLPDEANAVIIVDIPFSKMKEFYVKIDEYLKSFLLKYDEVFLSAIPPHLYAQNYDLKLLNLNEPDYTHPIKKICFIYRKDRLWGLTLRAQQRRIEKLFNVLQKDYPDLKFFIIGQKDNKKFKPKFIEDKRVSIIDQKTEEEWNNILFNSLVIGIHGSNMLIAAALAKYVIELIPESRYSNAIQATLISDKLDGFQLLHKFRYIYGNEDLTNIDKVIKKITLTLLDEDYDNIALYYQNKKPDWENIQKAYSFIQYRDENSLLVKFKRKSVLILKKFLK